MITYKYKLYKTHKTKHIDDMLREACFVWNHALALQKRYYKIYHKYISLYTMESHFTKRHKRTYITSQSRNEILERLDLSYRKFFNHTCKRPPKFKGAKDFHTICFKTKPDGSITGIKRESNTIIISRKWKIKFFSSRPIEGKIKRVTIKRTPIGEYYVRFYTDANAIQYGKKHNGASVGIDFGLKTYLTLSDGKTYDNPQYFKENLIELHRRCRNLSKCKKGSHNRKRKLLEFERLYKLVANKRNDFQWKLAHELCRKYDTIFIEDLFLSDMMSKWGRKISDYAHAEFVKKLEYVATKYNVKVHKIERYYPSSKTCTCGHINNELKLNTREWVCPVCGEKHSRDLLAANNILRRGIYEMESGYKSSKQPAKRLSHLYPTIAQSA